MRRLDRFDRASSSPSESLTDTCGPPTAASCGGLAARTVPPYSTPQPPPHRHTVGVGELFANEGRSRRQVDLRLKWSGPGPRETDPGDNDRGRRTVTRPSRDERAARAAAGPAHPSPGLPVRVARCACKPSSPATSGRLAARAIQPRSSPLLPPRLHIQVVSGLLANKGRGGRVNPIGENGLLVHR